MKVEMAKVISSTSSLPSLPAVAAEIVKLAQDPNVNLHTVAEILAKDPAMTTKVLRMVNSSMYSRPRQVENLHQAIVIMGLDQTMSMALSFSLISSMKKGQGSGLDYDHYWRRMLLAATAARVIGEFVGEEALEELFLAALLQDIGMLALDRFEREFYVDLGDAQFDQKQLLAYENERMDADHAHLGAELLQKWNLAERTCNAVKYSHDPKQVSESNVNSGFIRCVALSGHVADLFVNIESQRAFLQIGHMAHSFFNFDHKNFQVILERIAEIIPDIESLFDTSFVSDGDTDSILDQAREILVNHNLDALREVDRLKREAKQLDAEARVYKESGYRDAITGMYNRQYLEDYLQKVFLVAKQTGKPVSVVYVMLKELASINTAHGHGIGDKVLNLTAKTIKDCVPESSVLSRYGGGEFVIVLPGLGAEEASGYSSKIMQSFHDRRYKLTEDDEVSLSVAVGIASQGDVVDHKSVAELFKAAENSLLHAAG